MRKNCFAFYTFLLTCFFKKYTVKKRTAVTKWYINRENTNEILGCALSGQTVLYIFNERNKGGCLKNYRKCILKFYFMLILLLLLFSLKYLFIFKESVFFLFSNLITKLNIFCRKCNTTRTCVFRSQTQIRLHRKPQTNNVLW